MLLLLVVLLGPRVDLRETPYTPKLPDDLESYLAREEAQAGPLVPGTEKHIVWAEASHQQTELALVYLHGFSASRQETAPLCEDLAASLHANLFCTRFAGHGLQDKEALGKVSVDDWYHDAREALAIGRRLGRRVILIGVSNGGALATWLAANSEPSDLQALILLAPNFGLARPDSEVLLLPWGQLLVRSLVGERLHVQAKSEEHARYWTMDYPSRALLPMMGAVEAARRSPLGQLQVPALLIHAEADPVVSTAKASALFARFGSAQKQELFFQPHPGTDAHVLAGRIRSAANTKEIEALILHFLSTLPPNSGSTLAARL